MHVLARSQVLLKIVNQNFLFDSNLSLSWLKVDHILYMYAPTPARRAKSSGSRSGTSKSQNSPAVIGVGSGAAAGAILTKKKDKGAIIGGIIGATGRLYNRQR